MFDSGPFDSTSILTAAFVVVFLLPFVCSQSADSFNLTFFFLRKRSCCPALPRARCTKQQQSEIAMAEHIEKAKDERTALIENMSFKQFTAHSKELCAHKKNN